MNKTTRECFPSLTTISKNIKCSRTKILFAINRLCECSLLKKKNNGLGKNNTYIFENTLFDSFFDTFTEEFLRMDMPLNVKEYYMGIQQFLYGKETGVGRCSLSNSEIARKLGISIASVKKYNTYLIENEYLAEETCDKTDEGGLPIIQKNFNLEGLNQAALWVKAVTEQVTKNTDDIEKMKQELEELKDWKRKLEKEESLARNWTQKPIIIPL